jgi:predicted short-subunit dehydrogenase-like oxidoreductase (DUF2520 family)
MEAGHPPGNRTLALVGPGRAGTTISLALLELDWTVVAVAGRSPEAPSTAAASACLDADATLVSDAGRGASLVIVATPDRAIEAAARAVAPSLEAGALVVQLAGSLGVDAVASMLEVRPDVRVGAMHPLQTFPSASIGVERLRGAWAAVVGDPQTTELAIALGMRPFELRDSDRAQYHAAAVVASNHLVALLGQVERLAAGCGVPFEAFAPLVRSSVANAFGVGPARALTGPVARGDLATVGQHLATLDPGERDTYRTLAREFARITGRRDHAIDRLLEDVRHAAGEHTDPDSDDT